MVHVITREGKTTAEQAKAKIELLEYLIGRSQHPQHELWNALFCEIRSRLMIEHGISHEDLLGNWRKPDGD